jgi:hypothetical protein
MDYKVAREYNIHKLIKSVNKLIEEGYDCQGGLAISEDKNHKVVYYQAMLRGQRHVPSNEN